MGLFGTFVVEPPGPSIWNRSAPAIPTGPQRLAGDHQDGPARTSVNM